MLSILLTLSLASAQQQAKLVDGTPEFQECINDPGCSDRFYRFLTTSMAEQGFTFQNEQMLLSAVVSRREGVQVGGELTTFPLTPPRANLSGKEENTSFSPVLPRLRAGWLGAAGPVHIGVGGSLLPPIPVGGASALVAGLEGSIAAHPTEKLAVGGELDFSFTRARAPIVASEEQFEARKDFDNPNNLDPKVYNKVCAPNGGCTDTYTQANLGIRAGLSGQIGSVFTPYTKLGLTMVNETLFVEYDATKWRVAGLQPSWSGGGVISIGEHVDLGLGTAIAYRPPALDPEPADPKAGAFFKLHGAAAWTF
jgi:hypothetical protein